MSVFVDAATRVLVQGITGREGSFHTEQMIAYGTKVVAGVTPGRGGREVYGVPVFDTVDRAVRETGANASIIFVPAPTAAEAILAAAEAAIPLVVCITEGIPIHDMVVAYRYLQGKPVRLIGPNCPGLISPDKCKLGIMAGDIHLPGRVGVVSRSGTLTYETVAQLTALGVGQSTCIGIGGDPIVGSTFVDVLQAFAGDEETRLVVLIGEIGGELEQEAAQFIRTDLKKPVVAYVAGSAAPEGRRMGHAGAIISGESGRAEEKTKALAQAGAIIVPSPAQIGSTVKGVLASL